jgi:hypothetical protein
LFSSNAYVIRAATPDDEPVLRTLAALDSRPPLSRPALIGVIDAEPAAAISLVDGRIVADPFRATAQLAVHLRLRAKSVLGHDREPSLAARIRAGVGPAVTRRPQTAA